ncbi:MAG: ComF family protein, partial [Pseudomonadales bacterium]|nr:ComF family protein [Pseudomonadales bacterium]
HCAYCLRQRPVFQRCIAATLYSPPSAQLVNRLKHHGQLGVASTLANEIALALQRHAALGEPRVAGSAMAAAVDVIVPVPLHRRRLRQRGYNQAVQIGRALGRQLEIPLDLQACLRQKEARAQQTLSRRQRTSNLHGAFVARSSIAGMRVAIVDDVVTTTSTANAVAASLLQAGALSCDVWCFARTPAPG